MELIIGFLIALGVISSDYTPSQDELNYLQEENHEQLVDEYGIEYLTIIGTDENEN